MMKYSFTEIFRELIKYVGYLCKALVNKSSMTITEEYLSNLIDRMAKVRRIDARQHKEWYSRKCVENESNPLKVWKAIVNYSEFFDFPEDIDRVEREYIEVLSLEEVSNRLVEYKYPDLQNIFAFLLVLAGRGLDVLENLCKRNSSMRRDTAIYAILHNVFYVDKNRNTFELPNYLSDTTIKWFVPLFFNNMYRYDGRYTDGVYLNLLPQIGHLCKLKDNYLKDDLGCILIVIEQCLDELNADQKKELLVCLDNNVSSYLFSLKAYDEAVNRVVNARGKLIRELNNDDYIAHFDDEFQKCMTRYEGWCISEDSLYYQSNKETVVLLSWFVSLSNLRLKDVGAKCIIKNIYGRLQCQIKLADSFVAPYKVAIEVVIESLVPESELYDEILSDFIQQTDNLYDVICLLQNKLPLSKNNQQLLYDRWKNESETFWIKIQQMAIWNEDVKKKVRRLGFPT